MSSLIEGLAVAVKAIMGTCKEMENNIHDLSFTIFYTKKTQEFTDTEPKQALECV